MTERVITTIAEGVAHVRLSRPEKMNALDGAMFAALVAAGDAVAEDPAVRAVVLSGEGRAFCAGIDVAQFGQGLSFDLLPAARYPDGANLPQRAATVWRSLGKPVVVAIHGVAFGGGLQIALGGDLRFASADARLSFMEIRYGLVPDMGGFALVRDLLRGDHARDLILSGRIVEAGEAAALGLVTRVCTDPLAEALAYAGQLAGHSASAMAAAKRLLDLPATTSTADLLLHENEEQVALIGSPEQKAAVEAAFAKR